MLFLDLWGLRQYFGCDGEEMVQRMTLMRESEGMRKKYMDILYRIYCICVVREEGKDRIELKIEESESV